MSGPPSPPPWHAEVDTVGVTGTNGKTTTTAWVAAALGAHALQRGEGPVARATTVGFFVGDVRQDLPQHHAGFLEGMDRARRAGGRRAAIELTSEALARGFARAWPCRVGIFTNLSHDHLDAHGSPEHYLASKAQLFVALPPTGAAVLNAADACFPLLREVVPPGVRVLAYAAPSRGSILEAPTVRAEGLSLDWDGTRIALGWSASDAGARRAGELPAELAIRAIGEPFTENAMAALLGAVAAGVAPTVAARAIGAAAAPPGRFEVVSRAPSVVVDYAHTPDALARTVATARELARRRLVVVFGAGGGRDRAKRFAMGAAARPADVVILTSDNPRDEDPAAIARAIAQGLAGHRDVRYEPDRRTAIAGALTGLGSDDVLLVAGKGHEVTQEIAGQLLPFSDVAVLRELLAHR